MNVIEHLEKYIGLISKGADVVDKRYNLTISTYYDIPFENLSTFSTLGLNKYYLDYYYEFIIVAHKEFDESEIISFLTSFSEFLIDNKRAVRRGDVLSFDFSLFSETKMNSVYITLPFYFEDGLQELTIENKTIIFPLIIPVYDEEAKLIQKKGWESFESFLEDNDIDDLWNFKRNKYSW